ncbi:MAG: SBBP repeat-containing protein, partial [Nitrosopumilus sp.]|nr:SBBP repeat-containing protein [Nitrosopumilus sp.]
MNIRKNTPLLAVFIFLISITCVFLPEISNAESYLSQFGAFGSGDIQLNNPEGIALDSLGNIYVADTSNNRVQKFNSAGVFQLKFGTSGSGNGQFSSPIGIALDS